MRNGVALIMVLLVLSALAMIGAPFVISMALQEKASLNFEGAVAARQAAEAASFHAIAHLEKSAYGYEYEEEEEILDRERPRTSTKVSSSSRGKSAAFTPRARPKPAGRGMIVRKDLGDVPLTREEKERLNRRGQGRTREAAASKSNDPNSKDAPKLPDLPDSLKTSRKGPSPREFDLPEELAAKPLDRVKLPGTLRDAPPGTTFVASAEANAEEFRFQDPAGVTASAMVWDEQGKINLNSAPPNLIANLFGVSQLALPLAPRDTKLALDDASMFRGDLDSATIDGAVVVVDAEAGVAEAITYRKKDGDMLDDCFRGAYLSLILNHVFPAGSFVYDLRGWKAGYHRLWAQREGGFHPRELTKFSCVEAIREIASWQIASLFVTRFRGEGLTAEFLRQAGVNLKRVSDLGLDPYIFPGAGVDGEGDQAPEMKKRLEEAKRQLRKIGLKSDVVQKLKEARGPRVVIDLAARLDGADKEHVKKLEADLEKSLSSDKRRAPAIPEKYLQEALKNLAEAYRAPGLETIEPEDLEWLRDCVTVSSQEPAEWSEAQSVLDDVSLTGPEYMARVSRASEFNPGTVVRIRSAGDASSLEFNEAAPTGKNIPQGGIRFAHPLQGVLKGYDGTVQALQRHPVNINTASRRVLRAVFTGVRGYAVMQVVTPYKADQLAARAEGARPFKGHDDFYAFLQSASQSGVIDGEDVQPLLVNAIQPTHNLLRVSTTGFTYATGDVYTIESRGVLRSPSGTTVAESRFRELVEVSAPRRLSVGLITQADFSDGVFLMDPFLQPGFPENRHQYLLEFPGTRSHLVLSRPLLLHRAPLSFPGGDLGNLRLFPSETPETMQRFTVGKIEHFRETYEGLELAQGEQYSVSLDLEKGAAGGSGGGGGIGSGVSYLNMVPGGIELWFRMRTYPDARSQDGHIILFDAGTEEERNRISILYDVQQGRVHLRISDASISDPSVVKSRDNGQYLEVTAKRPLELETWYHLRAVWDGVFGGGAQLFIDGIPAGTDNLSSELVSAIPEHGNFASISVKDASKFPREGVVRIDQELFEYTKSGNSLQVRHEQPSAWQPIQRSKARRTRGRIEPPKPKPPGGPGGPGKDEASPTALPDLPDGSAPPELPDENFAQVGPGPGPAGPAGPAVDMTIKRAPGNRRGSVPAAHAPGARVAIHGYSLEMRRKLHDPKTGVEFQIGDGDGSKLVWGPGGLRTAEPLYAFNFPPDISEIIHFDMDPKELGSPGDYIVPLFHLDSGNAIVGGLFYDKLSAVLPNAPRNAIEYFQSRGVLTLGGQAFFYRKEDLPPTYLEVQKKFQQGGYILQPQTKGLKILADYARGGSGLLANWQRLRKNWDKQHDLYRSPFGSGALVEPDLTHRSLLASGPIQGLYPDSGILELRGSPTPWEAYRPNYYGQPAFGKNPDDVVEWIRYVEIVDQPVGGEQFHLFVGRPAGNFNFRGYPERDDHSLAVDLRKQLDHPINDPIRLVMELSDGGAGYGDYVTIATRDPNIYEPGLRRVYKVLEHDDGRFFASLLEVGQTGMDIPASPGKYKNSYTMSMNPRLVKFPTWGLPEIGTAKGLFFGDVVQGVTSGGAGRPGRSNLAGVRNNEDEDPTGVTIDEVRKLQNKTIQRDPRYTVRHVVVPLEGGAVQFRGGGPGTASISGRIPADRTVSRSSPIEVLVVTLSRERGFPALFAKGEDEGVLRIGDELFYFEDPLGGQGKAAAGKGTQQGFALFVPSNVTQQNPQNPQNPANPNAIVNDTSRERDPLARTTVSDRIGASGMVGHFEREGFARLEDHNAERAQFHEVFYYKQLSGGFSQCLRGQFGTPIAQNTTVAVIHNVTRRLRLVGRSLLGSERAAHSLGEAVSLVPYMNVQPVTGPLTNTGLPVKKTTGFGRAGYVLLDSGEPTMPWEILAHLGPQGEGLLARPRDERGKGILRACFGTKERPISNQMFAYDMPYRFPDRYETETDSESLAYLQKSFRVPGGYWRSIEWTERASRTLRERRADVVVLARFDGAPEWDQKPTNAEGGLYLLEDKDRREDQPARGELNRMADQLEIRAYFRFPSGAFSRLPNNRFTDDWKETPVLESLTIEYEKAGAIVRHEELPF